MVYGATQARREYPYLEVCGRRRNRWGHLVDLAAIPFDLAPRTAHRAPRTAHLNESVTLVGSQRDFRDDDTPAMMIRDCLAMIGECVELLGDEFSAASIAL